MPSIIHHLCSLKPIMLFRSQIALSRQSTEAKCQPTPTIVPVEVWSPDDAQIIYVYMWLSVVVNCNCKWMWKLQFQKDHPMVHEPISLSHSLDLFCFILISIILSAVFQSEKYERNTRGQLAWTGPPLDPCRDPNMNNKDHWLITPWPLQVGPGDDLVLAPSHVEVKRWIWNNVHSDCDGGGFWRYL